MTSIRYENHFFILEDYTGVNHFKTAKELSKLLESRYWGKSLSYFIFRNSDTIIHPDIIKSFRKDYPYFIDDTKLCKLAEEGLYNTIIHRYYYQDLDLEKTKSKIKVCLMLLYIEHPQIELMAKLNCFDDIIIAWSLDQENPKYTRSFKKGSNISDITNMPRWMWKRLSEERLGIDSWNSYRIWNNQIKTESKKMLEDINAERKSKGLKLLIPEGMTKEALDLILDLNLDSRTLEKVRKIIRSAIDEEGKPLLTVEKLIKFLERVDMYQAISPSEAVDILTDYIRMCKQLGTEPRLDSDSLKREHDVTARNYAILQREKRKELDREKGSHFIERAKTLSKYEYSNEKLTAIVPKTVSDLINEGYHNHNCVGSYVDAFVKGNSNIFFIRKASEPTKSYITIELNKNCTDYRQAYYAGNQKITKKEDLSFIKEWLENNKKINEQ